MSNSRSNKNQRRSGGGGANGNNPNQGSAKSKGGKSGGGSGANAKNGNGGGRQGSEKGRGNSRRRKGSRKKQVDPRVFWGDPEQLAELGSERATITDNPSAVVQSLGRPPLSGQQNAAEHYFVAVYDRAVNLAAALAAAGNLLESGDPDDDRPLDPEE